MKVFGIGLPRSGTTSIAVAMLDLGFRTCHNCFSKELFDTGDAFFDTPVYADYPMLDRQYPGSKFILTWRDPGAWARSFSHNLNGYLKILRELDNPHDVVKRCYLQVFGTNDQYSEEYLISCYRQHRQQAEDYFHNRKGDLLILDMDAGTDTWQDLCGFLGVARPAIPFPRLNASGSVHAWDKLEHPYKLSNGLR